MKKNILLFALSFFILLNGCGKMVVSYRFSIEEFDAFFNIVDTVEKESYISEGNMEFARVDNMIICPLIKEINYEECSLFIYVYSLNEDSKKVVVNNAFLSTQDGVMLCDVNSIVHTIELTSEPGRMLSGMAEISTFDKTEKWFHSGNELQLSLQVAVDNGAETTLKDLSYKVIIKGYKRHLMPT